jgi:hypothetical protein
MASSGRWMSHQNHAACGGGRTLGIVRRWPGSSAGYSFSRTAPLRPSAKLQRRWRTTVPHRCRPITALTAVMIASPWPRWSHWRYPSRFSQLERSNLGNPWAVVSALFAAMFDDHTIEWAGRASDRRKGRLVPIRLPTPPTPPMRRPIKGFDKERPRILGALLDAVAYGLKRLPHVRLKRLPRMADFAVWIAACEPALWEAGTFADAYQSNRDAAAATTIEADLVASALSALMDTRNTCWAGTATELLAALAAHVPESQQRGKGWPVQPNLLTGRLRRMAPAMRKIGIMIRMGDRKRDQVRSRMIEIGKTQPENRASSSSASSASSASNNIKILQRTIMDEPSSVPSSDDPGPPVADDDADDQGRDIVRKRGKTRGGMILRFPGGRESDSFWECRGPGILTVCRTPS